jgi:ribosomal protein S1
MESGKGKMAALLAKSKAKIVRLRSGEMVEGKVISKSKDELVLNIGAKAEGVVSGKELEDEAETFKKIKEGDKVLATVLQAEDNRGYVLLSLKKAEPEKDWRRLKHALDKEEVLEVEVLGPNRGGLLARFGSQRGFIPFSHISLKNKIAANAGELEGKTLAVRVIELDQNLGRIVLSERDALTTKEREAEVKELAKVDLEETYEGEITSITPFGVFVKFDSLEGMVHVSELSWEKIADPKKHFKIGDSLKVKVVEVNDKEGKITLSHKQTLPNPWEKIAEKYPEGKKIKGKVTKIVDFGAFVELEPGIEGLIHVTETTGPLSEGDEVEARLVEVDPKKQKIALSLKAIGAGWR